MRPVVYSILTALICLSAISCATNSKDPAQPAQPKSKNLALGKMATSNNHIYDFVATNAVDGDPASYWEGAADSYPNEFILDLGSKKKVTSLIVKLNPKRIWQARTEKFEILTSEDGESFQSAVVNSPYSLDPVENKNVVTIPVSFTTRYLKLSFTANDGATAGQVGELEVYGE